MEQDMNIPVRQSPHSTLDGPAVVTETPSGGRNQPVGGWMPGFFHTLTLTESGQQPTAEDERWGELAASARADWFAENSFE